MPDVGDNAGHDCAQEKGGDADQDDFARSVTVGTVAAEGGQQRARDAGEGVGQRDSGRVPAHLLFQRDNEHPECLADGTAGHVHEGGDGDDYPGVVDTRTQTERAYILAVEHQQHSFCACAMPMSIDIWGL